MLFCRFVLFHLINNSTVVIDCTLKLFISYNIERPPNNYDRPNLDKKKIPMGPSKIARDTTTANRTPNISIITWMVVEECAGSMPNHSNMSGRIAPRQILLKTIKARAADSREGRKARKQ